ncbi:MAG: phosphatidylinositol mannoside acyltransferase [Actinomycetota bacterium]|nr:phosphatidylinositol mannoside acyltransferase [Actinomycetota bacterium]
MRAERRQQAVYAAYRALGLAMSVAPEPVAALAAAAVGEAMAVRRGPAWEQRSRHLRRVLAWSWPGASPDDDVVRRWTRRAYRSYARYWLEGARLPAVGAAEVNQRMMVERGYEHLQKAMAAGQGVVMALPHVGSWEWGGSFLASQGYPMTSVAERIEPPALFEWFVEERKAIGLTIVPLGPGSGPAVLRTLRAGGLVGLLCDRDLVGDGVEVEFFGERTTLPAGPATLALRTGAVLVGAVVYSGPGREHTAEITAPLDASRSGDLRADVQRITQSIARVFEQFVARCPEQWHLYQPNWPSDHPADSAS